MQISNGKRIAKNDFKIGFGRVLGSMSDKKIHISSLDSFACSPLLVLITCGTGVYSAIHAAQTHAFQMVMPGGNSDG